MSEPFLSEIKIVSFNFPPKGWALCNGQSLPINQNQAFITRYRLWWQRTNHVQFAQLARQGPHP